MGQATHERFASANRDLRDFLMRVEALGNGTGMISEEDMKRISQRLLTLAPEVGDASRSKTLDAALKAQIDEYVRNLKSMQRALEKVCCIMLARKSQLEAAKRHMEGLRGWVSAYHQTI